MLFLNQKYFENMVSMFVVNYGPKWMWLIITLHFTICSLMIPFIKTNISSSKMISQYENRSSQFWINLYLRHNHNTSRITYVTKKCLSLQTPHNIFLPPQQSQHTFYKTWQQLNFSIDTMMKYGFKNMF